MSALDSLRALFQQIDTLFAGVAGDFLHEVACRAGCIDCCHAFFDVSYAEAYAVAGALQQLEDGADRKALQERARLAREETTRLLSSMRGGDAAVAASASPLLAAANWRVRCPLLADNQTCLAYAVRPATCRIYGIPTEIAGKGHVCGFSGFAPGGRYPTVKLETVREVLRGISVELAQEQGAGEKKAIRRFFLYEAALMTL